MHSFRETLAFRRRPGQVSAMTPRIAALATKVPPHRISQPEVREAVAAAMPGGMPERLGRVYDQTGIRQRHLIQPADRYLAGQDFETRNRVYLEAGQALLTAVAEDALAAARLRPVDIDLIVAVSSTGIATPSMPSQMLAPMGFDAATPILPLFG